MPSIKMEQIEFINNIFSYAKLIGFYLNKKELSSFKIDDNRLSFYIKLSKHHSLKALLYKALLETKAEINPNALSNLEHYYLASLRKDVLFERERQELFHFLEENSIEYLPLKGIVLRELYPDPHSREFADNDILFKHNDKKIKDFFVKRDYEVVGFQKSHEDVYLKKPFFNFEMHRDLFGGTNDGKYIKYFKNYLERAPIKEGCEHYLKDEDFYIYFTAHSYKHFNVSGCGIRTLVDYYLFLRNSNLDFDYINKELKKLDLVDFSSKISTLSKKVFDDEPLNKDEEEMLMFIASSGTYGTLENRVEKGINEKGKLRYFLSRVFPPYSYYKMPYPWAYYCPFLIPFAWFVSFIKRVFRDPKRATNELKMISKQKKQK